MPDTEAQAASLAAAGFKLADPEPEEFQLWAEHQQAFTAFCRLRTQWQVGFNGEVGLRYETLGFVLEMEQVPRADWPLVVNEIQLMEHAMLQAIHTAR